SKVVFATLEVDEPMSSNKFAEDPERRSVAVAVVFVCICDAVIILPWVVKTYTLVYAFLTSRDHAKAAKAVKKAAKEAQVISIKPGVQPTTDTSLDNIVYEWKELSARNAELEELKEHLMEEIRELRGLVMLTREQAPVISGTTAWLISAFFATSYVASLYMFRAGRLAFRQKKVEAGPNAAGARAHNEEGRDSPTVIKARLSSVAISTLVSCGIMLALITKAGSWNFGDLEAIHQTLKLLGLTLPTGVPLGAWFLAPIMYTGTLYTEILDTRSSIYRHDEEGGSYYRGDCLPFLYSRDHETIRSFHEVN
ncbi:3265_t:CDS:2, partial [Acaulospora colombiana]